MTVPPDGAPPGKPKRAQRLTGVDATYAVRRLLDELRLHQAELEAQNAELNRVQEQLEESLRRYAGLYNDAPLAYITLDALDQIVEINPAGATLLGDTSELLVGRQLRSFLREDMHDRYSALIEAARGTVANQTAEFRLRCPHDTTERSVRIDVRAIAATAFAVMLIDVSERRLLERSLLDATNHERQRFGADLHDGVAQDLAALTLKVAALVEEASGLGSPLTDRLRACETASRKALVGCRALARGMSPLDDCRGGLVQGMHELVQHAREAGGAEVELEVDLVCAITLAGGHQEHVYRIAQEALNNARRHSHGRRIKLAFVTTSTIVELRIEDDGRGLPTQIRPDALGLRLMEHRANTMGARFSITSASGKGTRVSCVCRQG